MKISEIRLPGWQVLRDGNFSALALSGADPGLLFLTFVTSEKYLKTAVNNPLCSCILCCPALAEQALASGKGVAMTENPRLDFFLLHNDLAEGNYKFPYTPPVQPNQIGVNSKISSFANIGTNIVIGDNVVIEAYATVKDNVHIGNNCIIRSGTVLGGTGLEFIRMGDAGNLSVLHCGGLKIGNDVEIQYNCNVSRSLFPWDDTEIGDQVKIESLVHVAHGVKIGARTLVAASAVIGGSARIGSDCWVGLNATISSEVRIGDGARVSLGAVVAGNVPAGSTVSGNFAMDHQKFMSDLMNRMLSS